MFGAGQADRQKFLRLSVCLSAWWTVVVVPPDTSRRQKKTAKDFFALSRKIVSFAFLPNVSKTATGAATFRIRLNLQVASTGQDEEVLPESSLAGSLGRSSVAMSCHCVHAAEENPHKISTRTCKLCRKTWDGSKH